MFVGVEILNECNHGAKGQNRTNLSLPEIQVKSFFKKCLGRLSICGFTDVPDSERGIDDEKLIGIQ